MCVEMSSIFIWVNTHFSDFNVYNFLINSNEQFLISRNISINDKEKHLLLLKYKKRMTYRKKTS